MCILPRATTTTTTAPATTCPAHHLTAPQRAQLAVAALAGTQPISLLAAEQHVSRKFVSQQADKAQQALHDAFDPGTDDDRVLFHLPVTRTWLRQLTLGLVLICHSSCRGVIELLRDLFDYDLSLGTVHNIVHSAIPRARARNDSQDLSRVRIGAAGRERKQNPVGLDTCEKNRDLT